LNGAEEYVDFSLFLHASKVVLKILTQRLENKETYLGKNHHGFRKGHGTRDAIAALRVLYEISLEHNNSVYLFC